MDRGIMILCCDQPVLTQIGSKNKCPADKRLTKKEQKGLPWEKYQVVII